MKKTILKITIGLFIPIIFIGCSQKEVTHRSKSYLGEHHQDKKSFKREVNRMMKMRH